MGTRQTAEDKTLWRYFDGQVSRTGGSSAGLYLLINSFDYCLEGNLVFVAITQCS